MGRFAAPRPLSPVEEDWLKSHHSDMTLAQLGIMLGRSPTTVQKYAAQVGIVLNNPNARCTPKPNIARAKQGRREDLGIAVRSPWEANVLRVLTHLGIRWEYEPRVFHFIGEKRGATSYMPDIFLPDLDLWIEVKGLLNSEGRSKVKKFSRYFPGEFKKLRSVTGTPTCSASKAFASIGVPSFAFYNVLRYDYALALPHWEHDSVSEKWAASKRTRTRPSDVPLPIDPPRAPKRAVRGSRRAAS